MGYYGHMYNLCLDEYSFYFIANMTCKLVCSSFQEYLSRYEGIVVKFRELLKQALYMNHPVNLSFCLSLCLVSATLP